MTSFEEIKKVLIKQNRIKFFISQNKEYSNLPETYLFSNKRNLNCSNYYRHKNNQNVMCIESSFEFQKYAEKRLQINCDKIIFSMDMKAELLIDFETNEKFVDKLADYENLYTNDSDLISTSSDFLNKVKSKLYDKNSNITFSGNFSI